MNTFQTNTIGQTLSYSDNRLRANSMAAQLYHTAHKWGRMRRVRSMLTGKSHRLFNLETIQTACNVRGRHYAGVRTVSIGQIRGSEGRSEDFDVNFSPLQTHTRNRWLRIAVARQAGEEMPPVKLIRIGDVYFVRDGHHRISVARALGQKEIEAEVMVWQIAGPPPWKPQAQSCAWVNPPVGQVAC
ncbi:MAG: hypothetical protein GY832_16700 [Chloroflexi bacterium]|nr:hypothetical protein [Chloroflexota bacterium]